MVLARTPVKKKILVVDDHPIIREGIRMLLRDDANYVVCGEAESVAEAMAGIALHAPDMVIVDLALKGGRTGFNLLQEMREQYPHLPALVLSMRDEDFYAELALRAGARGFVVKEEGPQKVIEGIRKVLLGQVYVSDRIATRVMGKIAAGAGERGQTPVDSLTDRELEIFRMIGSGLPTREIARELRISPKTIDSHRENIKKKLMLGSAAELLRQAVQWVRWQKAAEAKLAAGMVMTPAADLGTQGAYVA